MKILYFSFVIINKKKWRKDQVKFLRVASAKKLHKKDAPEYFNTPTWNEKYPSATGLA